MANITGTIAPERIDITGYYVWDPILGWVRRSAGTTTSKDTVNAGGGDDIVSGGGSNDTLNGQDGIDQLFGDEGNDTLNGGAGNDTVVGGIGADTLTGGTGSDVFVFKTVADSSANRGGFNSKTGDTVTDFTSTTDTAVASEQDKIDLRDIAVAIGRSSLTWGGSTATAFGVWQTISGSTTLVNVDTDGDRVADMVIRLSTVERLNAGDFLGVISPDNTAPTVVSASYGANDGSLRAGETVTLSITFSEAVFVAGGTPALSLNSGGTATYVSGSGTSTLVFSYTVGAGQTVSDLTILQLNSNGATIRDAYGNGSLPLAGPINPPGTLLVDTQAPVAPTVSLLSDTGTSAIDKITANGALAIGSETGALVQYSINSGQTWSSSFTPVEGLNTILVRQIDVAGNVSPTSSFSFTLDRQAPAAPAVSLASDTGPSSQDKMTSNGALAIGSEQGAIVQYAVNGGGWSSSLVAVEGTNTVIVRQTDLAGNVSGTTTFTFTLDTVAPASPTIDLVASSDTGSSDTDNITSDTTPTLAGTAEANSSVRVYDGATLLGQTTADSSGAWSLTTAVLGFGAHNFSARATDLAGNQGQASDILAVTIEVEVQAPTIDLVASSDSGSSDTDNLTNDDTPTLAGTAEANAIVRIYNGATLLGQTTTDSSGAWTFTTSALGNGPHSLSARSVSPGGIEGPGSSPLVVTVDTVAPASPTIDLVASSDTGPSDTDNITNDDTPTLAGTAEANSSVRVYDGATLLGQTTADSSGAWSFTTAVLGSGAHNFSARATDLAGNQGQASDILAVTIEVEVQAPTIDLVASSDTGPSDTDNITNDDTPTLAGTAEANAIVRIYNGATLLGQTTTDSSGAWTFTTSALGNGPHSLSARSVSPGGIEGPGSSPLVVTVDTVAPASPTIDLVASSDTGPSDTDNITNDDTPTLAGTAEANSSVRVYDGATLLGQTTADSSGAWSFTTAVLGSGAHNFSARATDLAGNQGQASDILAVTIEARQPPITQTISVRVASGNDDAEEVLVTSSQAQAGRVFTNSSDLELINDTGFVGLQLVGLRFANLAIPQGATITSAWIQFTVDERDSEPTTLNIKAQYSVNAASFAATNFDISSRPTTASAVTWSPAAWTVVGASGADQRTADLSTIIQDVVSLGGWQSGNAMAFIISGDGHRTATAFESGASTAPLLHIQYTFGGNNAVPVAVADFATTNEDSAVNIAVLGNDGDADGDSLVVSGVGLAAHGTVSINADSTLTYRPAANYHGADSFTYTVSDGYGGFATATVSVNVVPVNDNPVAVNDVARTPVGTAVTINVLANDQDVDGDTLQLGGVGTPQHGSVTVQPNGSLLYTPASGFVGADSFDYTAIDGNGGSSTATVTVNVGVNSQPVRFAIIGDYGVDNGYELAVSNLVKSMSPDFIVTTGDNIYGANMTPDRAVGKYYSDFIGNYQGSYGAGSAINRFFPVLGNHDWDDAGIQAYTDYFTLPASSSGNERYYDFIWGSVHFFMLDADTHEPDGVTPTSVQGQWLQNGLANSTAPWQVVVGHVPGYTSGNGNGFDATYRWPYEAWGADAVLNGHEHLYERLLRDDNNDGKVLPYFVNGSGGAGLYPFKSVPDPSSVVRYNDNYGAMLVTADDTDITFEFWSITNGGTKIDTYVMSIPEII